MPNSREKSANDFMPSAYETKASRNRSVGDSVGPGGTNCSKIEIRNSVTKLTMSTPKSAKPLRMSIVAIRSFGAMAVGGDGATVGGMTAPGTLMVITTGDGE